jgi:hypothetical protein
LCIAKRCYAEGAGQGYFKGILHDFAAFDENSLMRRTNNVDRMRQGGLTAARPQ